MSAPVTYERSDFLADATHIDMLWDKMPWVENDGSVPRYETWMNDYALPYSYSRGDFARTYEAQPRWPTMVDHLRKVVNAVNNTAYDCCFVNGYAHGRQHLGWHADDSPEMDPAHPIAVISFGAPREIWFRREPTDDLLVKFYTAPQRQLLENGSILTMLPGMQQAWKHRIPKSSDANCGRRISLTLRKLVR